MAALGKVATGAPDGIVPVTIEVGFGPLVLELLKKDGVVSRVRAWRRAGPSGSAPVTGDDVKGQIAAALGVPFDALHRDLPPQAVGTGNTFLMVPLASVAAVSSALADTRLLNHLERELSVLGLFFFAVDASPEGPRLRARMFAPGSGSARGPGDGLGRGSPRCLPRPPRRAARRRRRAGAAASRSTRASRWGVRPSWT